MPTTANAFDDSIAQWRKELTYPWFQLKYKLCHAHLTKQLPSKLAMHILDAGGGNGVESLPFAEAGHSVDLVDSSRQMLNDAQQLAAEKGITERVQLHHADVGELPTLFAPASFDLLLCHNVIQYLDDLPARLSEMAALLKPGGVASFVSVNRYSRPYSTAFLRNDLQAAVSEVGQRTFNTIVFQTTMTLYSAQELSELLAASGLQIVADYGILCMYGYWGDNERKFDPAIHAQLETLEFALSDQFPYKLLASYYQIIATKK